VSDEDVSLMLRVGVIAGCICSLASARVPRCLMVKEERGVKGGVMGVAMNQRRDTPTRYILTLSFPHHRLAAKRHVAILQSPPCPAIVRNRESPLGLLASLGKILRIHFSVSDLVVIGCRCVKGRLSGSVDVRAERIW
jgi:hypothetical protein